MTAAATVAVPPWTRTSVRHYLRCAPAFPALAAPAERYPPGALLAGEAVEGLPGAALRGLGVPGPHPGRREVGSRLSEPLL